MWGAAWEGPGSPDKAITTIKVSGLRGIAAFHVCSGIEAVARQDAKIGLTVTFNEGHYLLSDTDWSEVKRVLSYLSHKSHKEITLLNLQCKGSILTAEISTKGEQFLERTIECVIELIQVLGIKDEHKRICGNFKIAQETLVLTDKGWESLEDGLRQRFGLNKPTIHVSGN